jgi:Predicted ATPase of the PP-loop superfamily implicated in cell cycle control
MRCDRCGRDAVLFQRYSGMHLCSKHFKEDAERKIRRKIRKSRIGKGEKIALALSGGKDSSVAAYVLKNVFRDWKDIDLIAITIDEGIEGYRDEMIDGAKLLNKKTAYRSQDRKF